MTSHLPVQLLRARLDELDLPTNGRKPELQRRLRKALTKIRAEEERIASGAPRDDEVDPRCWTPRFTEYLVIDVEATCEEGKSKGFAYPNEIIELPVLLLRLPPSTSPNVEPELVDTFHTFVRPVMRPSLSVFCKTLTGITQKEVDDAPTFPEALSLLYQFLCKHDLLNQDASTFTSASNTLKGASTSTQRKPFFDPYSPEHRSTLKRNVLFCSHGPFDIRDFIPKSCWINGFAYGPPLWLRKCSILDVRKATLGLAYAGMKDRRGGGQGHKLSSSSLRRCDEEVGEDIDAVSATFPSVSSVEVEKDKKQRHVDSTIPGLLHLLDLEPFQGNLHSGLDDTRNIARLVCELVRRVILGARSWSDESRWDEPDGQQDQELVDGLEQLSVLGRVGDRPRPRNPPHRRAPITPLEPHIRDQLIAANVYLPEYPPPPSAPHAAIPSDDSRPSASEEVERQRLLKGGAMYYPTRWAWMGKKVGVVRWDTEGLGDT